MSKLFDTVISIGYEQGDFNSLPELITDISSEIANKLTDEVKAKPVKCNVFVIYHSLVEGADDLINSKSMGLEREQSRNNRNGIYNKTRLNKGNKRASKRTNKT